MAAVEGGQSSESEFQIDGVALFANELPVALIR